MWDGMFLSSFRLIPAHAGKTTVAALALHGNAAHPRSRGENEDEYGIDPMDSGSSPLTRGKPAQGRDRARNARLIPAHAGKTPEPVPSPLPKPAHPRSRGENGRAPRISAPHTGSSPLTRGKRLLMVHLLDLQRLIPAHAGKTRPPGGGRTGPAAHPRSRGENWPDAVAAGIVHGSSPLTRGKLMPTQEQLDFLGLIPAHAGKTSNSTT